MKRHLLLIFTVICIGIIIPCKVHAVDVTVGATTWYVWSSEGGDVDPGFLIGPAASIKFTHDYNLTFVYLYGKFTATTESGDNFKIKRHDSDLALNYKLNKYSKVFGGIKYIGLSSKQEVESDAYGPGLGLSGSYPITKNLFALGYVSVFYLWGVKDYADDGKDYFNNCGFNSNLSAAYYIASASTAVSLGWRYQYFIGIKDDNNKKFYGVTIAATYTFGSLL